MLIYIKLLYYIDLFLYSFRKHFRKEYYLKLEDYYYDHKINEYIVILRFRNKHAIIKKTITEIIKENFISYLHPCDSYIIGSMKIMQDNKFILKNCFIERDFDDYSIVEPCIDWVGIDFIENEFIFKIRPAPLEVKVSLEWIFKNKLIQFIDNKSAFLIGNIAASIYIQEHM